MLTVNRFVIHELKKEKNNDNTELICSISLGIIDEFSKKLIEQIHKSFKDDPNTKHANFANTGEKVFKNQIELYLEDPQEVSFYEFSQKSLIQLRETIKQEPFAVGGYYIFADYVFEGKPFISVVLLRKKDGLNTVTKNGVISVLSTQNLNIDKLGMGFRLNIGLYKNKNSDKYYIALIAQAQDKLSKYFKEWVAAGGVIDSQKNTKQLVTIIKTISLPRERNEEDVLEETGKERYTRDEFKVACYDYLKENKIVKIQNLSEYFYGDKFYITLFANEMGYIIDQEFKVSMPILKELIEIKAKTDGISITIALDRLNENEVDVQEDKIIIRSLDLVKQINEQANG